MGSIQYFNINAVKVWCPHDASSLTSTQNNYIPHYPGKKVHKSMFAFMKAITTSSAILTSSKGALTDI